MSIGEEDLASRIVRRLDRGLGDIDQRTLAKLRSARETALERFEPQPAWAFAWSGSGGSRINTRTSNFRHLLSVVALLVAISGMVYWQRLQNVEDPVDIDAKLLSGELPIDAYLDKGLDSWLTR